MNKISSKEFRELLHRYYDVLTLDREREALKQLKYTYRLNDYQKEIVALRLRNIRNM